MSSLEEIFEFSRSRVVREGLIRVGSHEFSSHQIVEALGPLLTDERRLRLSEVVGRRTYDFVSVFENPYDLGNISAVMRSSEAFGFLEFDLVIPPGSRFKSANRVARGADKWLDVQVFRSPREVVEDLKRRNFQVFATHLDASARPLDTLDFAQPTAVVLGNEKDGVSEEMLDLVDGRVMIPMFGFTQSFNISVAAALVFYQAWQSRRRQTNSKTGSLSAQQEIQLLANYYLRSFDNPAQLLEHWLATQKN